jgi:hypothetical protein
MNRLSRFRWIGVALSIVMVAASIFTYRAVNVFGANAPPPVPKPQYNI